MYRSREVSFIRDLDVPGNRPSDFLCYAAACQLIQLATVSLKLFNLEDDLWTDRSFFLGPCCLALLRLLLLLCTFTAGLRIQSTSFTMLDIQVSAYAYMFLHLAVA